MTANSEAENFPLADDDDVVRESNLMNDGRLVSPALPLIRNVMNSDGDNDENKVHLIARVLELQNTLYDLGQRYDNVKEECLKLQSENQILGQYMRNLIASSPVFQPSNAKFYSSK